MNYKIEFTLEVTDNVEPTGREVILDENDIKCIIKDWLNSPTITSKNIKLLEVDDD